MAATGPRPRRSRSSPQVAAPWTTISRRVSRRRHHRPFVYSLVHSLHPRRGRKVRAVSMRFCPFVISSLRDRSGRSLAHQTNSCLRFCLDFFPGIRDGTKPARETERERERERERDSICVMVLWRDWILKSAARVYRGNIRQLIKPSRARRAARSRSIKPLPTASGYSLRELIRTSVASRRERID